MIRMMNLISSDRAKTSYFFNYNASLILTTQLTPKFAIVRWGSRRRKSKMCLGILVFYDAHASLKTLKLREKKTSCKKDFSRCFVPPLMSPLFLFISRPHLWKTWNKTHQTSTAKYSKHYYTKSNYIQSSWIKVTWRVLCSVLNRSWLCKQKSFMLKMFPWKENYIGRWRQLSSVTKQNRVAVHAAMSTAVCLAHSSCSCSSM